MSKDVTPIRWWERIKALEEERDALQAKLDDMEDREYNLTRRALDTTPEGREFLGRLDKLQAKLDEYEKANWNAVLEITEVRKKLDIAVEAFIRIMRSHSESEDYLIAREALNQIKEES